MSSKKKDLEIIYNLQWKNKPANGGDKANIIGMYDIPSTTLNWEIFKSYLLKNSGTVGEDVKVSYITDSNREFPIENQTDFQIALYAFRRKSRMGDIVNLKLDRISEQSVCKNPSSSSDAQTQFSNEVTTPVSKCCNSESPPEWFTAYMSQFKKNMTNEITATVSCLVSSIKSQTVSQSTCHHVRKIKPEGSKRIRKLPIPTGEPSHETRDIIKSLKIEGRLERKLEKLEHKTKKIRDKKLALFCKSSDSEAGPSGFKNQSRGIRGGPPSRDVDEEIGQMAASPVNTQEIVPHMLGGEVYLHKWEVMNTGKLQWTNETALLFTWGSKALKPLDTIVPVPLLKPGEIGTISVRLQIPNYPGQYECYWHFHHKDRRFGHWLGCQVIVDQFDLKGNNSVLETSYQSSYETPKMAKSAAEAFHEVDDNVEDIWHGLAVPDIFPTKRREVRKTTNIFGGENVSNELPREHLVRDLGAGIGDLKLQDPTDTNCSSDSDNQSVTSLNESSASKRVSRGYVMVQPWIPAENSAEVGLDSTKPVNEEEDSLDGNNNGEDVDQNSDVSVGKGDDACSNASRKSDMVVVTIPDDGEKDDDYVFVMVDGKKVTIPKKIVKTEYLQANSHRSEASTPEGSKFSSVNSSVEVLNKEEVAAPTPKEAPVIVETPLPAREEIVNTTNLESNEFFSHCSAAGSCYSDANSTFEKNARLFVFPQELPGYEVIGYPTDQLSQTAEGNKQESCARVQPEYAAVLDCLGHPIPSSAAPGPTVADDARVDQQPLNLSTGVSCPQPAAQAAAATEPVLTRETSEGHQRENESPDRDFLTSERARRSSSSFLRPDSLLQGATTAFNTARSVINRMVPQEMPISPAFDVSQQPGKWVNGHWVSTNPETPREANLQALAEMGFWNRDLNATLLARYNDDLSRVVGELVQ